MIARRCALVVWLILLAPFRALHAQASAAAWGLFTVRYDTHTSDFIYALYGYDATFAMVGALHNPRTDWSELMGALGRMFVDSAGNSHAVATGVAQTGGLWYGQLYYVPSVRTGVVYVRATAELDYPISRGGVTQFALSPISATVRALGAIEVGAAMDLASARGNRTSTAIGPELRMPLPRATLGMDLERLTDGSVNRLRLFFTTQF